jgi:serine/threonine protein kinase
MVHPDLVGPHARESEGGNRPHHQEVLADRYQIDALVGHGHFTRAFLATDIASGSRVCVKAHHSLKVDNITDMFCIDQKLKAVDPKAELFPRLLDSFFDVHGYTVETLIEGQNCLELRHLKPDHFTDLRNIHFVARGALEGLALLAKVGIVHCDIKPDNIMWTDSESPGAKPIVRLIDFGCARLDRRLENGRNWSLAEGGAGHMGKWALEMFLRLPITDRSDVWGLAVTLLELISKRAMWCAEEDTEELMLAQLLGLAKLRDGMPKSMLQRSPIDVTRHYSPPPQCFPVRNLANAGEPCKFEELRPATWGLSHILGDEAEWDKGTIDFAGYVAASFTADPEERPSAEELLRFDFVSEAPDARKRVTTKASAVGLEARALFFASEASATEPEAPVSLPVTPDAARVADSNKPDPTDIN